MKKGWEVKKLGEVCSFKNGLWKGKQGPYTHVGVIRNTNFTKEGFLDDTDIAFLDVEAKQYESRKLEFGDIILEKSGGGPKQPVGRVILFEKKEGKYSFSNFTSVIRINDKKQLNYKFLHRLLFFYYISGLTEPMQKNSTNIRNLQLPEYKQLSIPLPPLSEQKRIVAILNEAFEGIGKAVDDAEKNLANARELFESYLNNVFTQKGKGWEEKRLGEDIDLLTGFAFKSKGYTEASDAIKLLRGDNIIQNALRWKNVKKWSSCSIESYAQYALEEGDVVLAMDRTWVKAGLKFAQIMASDLPCLLVQRVARLRVKKLLDSNFLRYLIGSKIFEHYVLSVQTGSGVPHISGSQINNFVFFRPPLVVQQNIAKRLDELSEETRRLEEIYNKKLESLAELKQSILAKAFSGELTA